MLALVGRRLRHSLIHYRKIAGLDAGRREAAPPKKGESSRSMAQSPQPDSKFRSFLGRRAANLMRFVHSTSTVVIEPPDAPRLLEQYHPFILAMWHGQFSLMPTLRELHGR